jgi:hypothetical protein
VACQGVCGNCYWNKTRSSLYEPYYLILEIRAFFEEIRAFFKETIIFVVKGDREEKRSAVQRGDGGINYRE